MLYGDGYGNSVRLEVVQTSSLGHRDTPSRASRCQGSFTSGDILLCLIGVPPLGRYTARQACSCNHLHMEVVPRFDHKIGHKPPVDHEPRQNLAMWSGLHLESIVPSEELVDRQCRTRLRCEVVGPSWSVGGTQEAEVGPNQAWSLPTIQR